MALTKLQANVAIKLFVANFANSNNDNDRKKLFIEFEDVFGRGISDWKSICRLELEQQTSKQSILEYYDKLLCRKDKLSKNPIVIRELRELDLEASRELINSAFDMCLTHFDNDRFSEFIKNEYSVVAEYNDDVVGVALAYIIPGLSMDAVYLDTFVVSENARDQGIGKQMLSYIQSIAVKNGIHIIKLTTDKKLEAYQIYQHWGFQEDKNVSMKKYFI